MCRFKKFFSGWLCVVIFCLSLLGSFCPYNTAYASGGTASSLVSYILSSLGVVNTLTDGGISAVAGDLKSRCINYVQQNLDNGTGVYENSDGEYVFTNDFVNGIYNILQANGSSDVRVIGSVPNADNSVDSRYYNSSLVSAWANAKNSYSSSLTVWAQRGNSSEIDTYCTIYDTSNLGYLNIYSNNNTCQIRFYGSNFSLKNLPYTSLYQEYYINSDSYVGPYSRSGYTSNTLGDFYRNSSETLPLVYNGVSSDTVFNTFPKFVSGMRYGSYSYFSGFYAACTNSYVLAKSSTAFNSYSGMKSGVVCVNRTNINNISKTVIANNDWDSIYNTTVQNIATNYDNDVNKNIPEGDIFDYDTLRRYMDQFSYSVVEAVESGTQNIEVLIYDTNNWLSLIYKRLGSIYQVVSDIEASSGSSNVNSGSVGSVSCEWTSEDIQYIKTHLSNIENSLTDYTPQLSTVIVKLNNLNTSESNNFHQLELLYTLLGDVYEAIQSGYSPTYPPPASYLPNVFDYLDDLPDSDILDYIDDMDIVVESMKNVVPFCFLGAGVVALTSLSHEPVAPTANIPFKFTSASTGTSFDDGFTIDISIFDSVHTVLITCECIGFMVLLGFLTVKVLYYLMGIL